MKVDHVGVFVTDLTIARRFCEQTLGLEWVGDDEDEQVWMSILRAGDTEVHLFRDKAGTARRGIDHVSIRVPRETLESRQLSLKEGRVAFRGPHRFQGTVYIKLADPDGITWELLAADADARTTDDRDAIIAAIRACNGAWRRGAPAEQAAFFAPDVVLVLPGFGSRLVGRDAAVQSFVDYNATVETLSFDETDFQVDVMGETAVAAYRFAVRYRLRGEVREETGRELLVFRRTDRRWEAVWRTQLAG